MFEYLLGKRDFSRLFKRVSFPKKKKKRFSKNPTRKNDSVGMIASFLLDRSPIDRFEKKEAREGDKGKKKASEHAVVDSRSRLRVDTDPEGGGGGRGGGTIK